MRENGIARSARNTSSVVQPNAIARSSHLATNIASVLNQLAPGRQAVDESDVRSTPKVKFTGVSGYDHLFDFVILKSRRAPERILWAINRPRWDSAEAFLPAWTHTQQVWPPDSRAFAVLNDIGRPVPEDVPEAFTAYNIRPVLWSQRDQVREELAA
jgi:hypothetical protein